MNFIEELKWRGLVQDITPSFEDEISNNICVGYIGFDPTSDSLHIGSLVQIIILKHFQNYGHKPIILIGGATGMIGDPSGKSKERNLLSQEIINKNIKSLKVQFSKFLNFDDAKNSAIILNNFDWCNKLNIIEFFRDFGKALTVNYMMSKDSVKKRLGIDSSDGMSFTEFTYQLFQAYDFYYLNEKHDCSIQMGGSDQWGNITSGVELIRKKSGKKTNAMTCPLITKVDGTKFGKTEEGNVWLDKDKTSPYKFYQYWLNSSDEDSKKYIKIFTFESKKFIEELIDQHLKAPHERILQKFIASELTKMVHSEKDLEKVLNASNILFSKNKDSSFSDIDEETFTQVFEGVPTNSITNEEYNNCYSIEELLKFSPLFKSKSDVIRSLKENSVSINKEKIDSNKDLSSIELIHNKYLVIQRGKKNYSLLLLT
ncbi:MAG: tyrosine--tRNA ligase [Bacteroidota bacterium]|nr:tyrosine--tRNA ligase [Bacteroidota bacterium]